MEKPPLPTALYCRLSREDGDRMESDSIGNQRKLLESYIENHSELVTAECYADDGYTINSIYALSEKSNELQEG